MTSMILRFRDLNIPDGETIRRHRNKLSMDAGAVVWWGWIMRQRETYPTDFFSQIACQARDDTRGLPIFLFDTGGILLFPATLKRIFAAPGGERVPAPEPAHTPDYMLEARCPAWFALSFIGDPLPNEPAPRIRLTAEGFPTLTGPGLAFPDSELLDSPIPLHDLRHSSVTIWHADVLT